MKAYKYILIDKIYRLFDVYLCVCHLNCGYANSLKNVDQTDIPPHSL